MNRFIMLTRCCSACGESNQQQSHDCLWQSLLCVCESLLRQQVEGWCVAHGHRAGRDESLKLFSLRSICVSSQRIKWEMDEVTVNIPDVNVNTRPWMQHAVTLWWWWMMETVCSVVRVSILEWKQFAVCVRTELIPVSQRLGKKCYTSLPAEVEKHWTLHDDFVLSDASP